MILLLTLVFMSNTQIARNNMRLKIHEKRFDKLEIDIKDSFNNIKNDISLIKDKLEV